MPTSCDAAPLPVCFQPSSDYRDDYRGSRCRDYPECKANSLATGTNSIICECDNGHTLRKVAIGKDQASHACELGDEWRVLHRLRGVPCVAQPVTYEEGLNFSVAQPIRPMRTIRIRRVRGRALMRCALNKQVAAEFGTAAACGAMRRTLDAAVARGVASHDLWGSNFMMPYADSLRRQCPFVLIDMPEHRWRRGLAMHWEHGWRDNCLLLRGAFSCDLRCDALPQKPCDARAARTVQNATHAVRRAAGIRASGSLCTVVFDGSLVNCRAACIRFNIFTC